MNKNVTPIPEGAILTGRGTTALWALLKSITHLGHKIILPVNICEIVIPAILNAGFTPVFYDVDAQSGNGRLDIVKNMDCTDTAACLAVHNFGTPLEIEPIVDWAHQNGLFLIEDVCNALGATWRHRYVGGFGDAAIFSFGHAKIIDVGGGGALYIREPEIQNKALQLLNTLPTTTRQTADAQFQNVLRSLRLNPLVQKPSLYRALYQEYLPYLLFMPDRDIREAIKQSLKGLEANLALRRENSRLWRKYLDFPFLEHPAPIEGEAFWRYTFLAPENHRDRILQALHARNIPASKWFPPIHALFDDFGSGCRYPGAEKFAKRCINLLVNQPVAPSHAEAVAEIIQETIETI